MNHKILKNKFYRNLILSLGIHLLFVISFYFVKEIKSHTISTAYQDSVQVELISPEVSSQTKDTTTKKSVTLPQQQIVDQDANLANEIAPDKTRFLSEKNQTVIKQTVTKNNGEFQNRKTKGEQQNGDPLNTEEKGSQQAETKISQPNKLDKFLPSMDSYEVMKKQMTDESGRKGEWQARANSGGDVSKTQDYLKDVNQGLETQLNTREYKYYGYYSRIRKQLSFHWEPKVREKISKMFKQGRTIASDADRITKLLIVLNSTGLLVKVQVLSESGVHDLDEAAIEAFRSAAPFPNPPKGIVETDGTVKIRWDFVLET